MKIKTIAILFLLLPVLIFALELPENTGRKVFPSPDPSEFDNPVTGSTPVSPPVEGIPTSSPAFGIVQMGREKMAEKKYPEAIEAFKTAVRLEPLNSVIWGLYDNAVIEDYLSKKDRDLTAGAYKASLKPNFSITRVDSYVDINNLCLVGHIKNISNFKKQKVVLLGRLFDKNKRELTTSRGTLTNYDKSLLPNEDCRFEIIFKDYPKTITDYKVEVLSWE